MEIFCGDFFFKYSLPGQGIEHTMYKSTLHQSYLTLFVMGIFKYQQLILVS